MKVKTTQVVEIVAECTAHGRFMVTRKPNRRQDNGSGRKYDGFYAAVKCPKCPWWATIVSQKMVDQVKAATASNPELPLEVCRGDN